MVLFHFAMLMVELYYVFVWKVYIDRIHIAFDLGKYIVLPVVVTGTLCYVVDCPYAHGFKFLSG